MLMSQNKYMNYADAKGRLLMLRDCSSSKNIDISTGGSVLGVSTHHRDDVLSRTIRQVKSLAL